MIPLEPDDEDEEEREAPVTGSLTTLPTDDHAADHGAGHLYLPALEQATGWARHVVPLEHEPPPAPRRALGFRPR